MAWIESHQGLNKHLKTIKLSRRLNITIAQAIGHLHMLWWWALDYAQDGNLSDCDPEDIAIAVDWPSVSAGDLVDALVHAGFLEKPNSDELIIHDWYEYAGKLIDRRTNDAKRKRKAETSARRPTDIRKTSIGHPPDVSRNSTFTEPKDIITTPPMRETDSPDQVDGFKAVHDAYCETHKLLQASSNDVMAIQRTIAGGMPFLFIVKAMRELFVAKQEREKQTFRKPRTFSYYEDAIREAWERDKLIQNGSQQADTGKVIPYAKSRTGPPRGSGEYDGLSV